MDPVAKMVYRSPSSSNIPVLIMPARLAAIINDLWFLTISGNCSFFASFKLEEVEQAVTEKKQSRTNPIFWTEKNGAFICDALKEFLFVLNYYLWSIVNVFANNLIEDNTVIGRGGPTTCTVL